jgi:hypothetical protein
MSSDERFKLIPVTAVPGLVEVRVYDELHEHVRNQHQEISRTFLDTESFEQAIESAISDPCLVYSSYNNSYLFVNEQTTNWAGHPICVPVKVVANSNSGYVKTVFFGTARQTKDLVFRREDSDE